MSTDLARAEGPEWGVPYPKHWFALRGVPGGAASCNKDEAQTELKEYDRWVNELDRAARFRVTFCLEA